jgi:hypothetical protein
MNLAVGNISVQFVEEQWRTRVLLSLRDRGELVYVAQAGHELMILLP